MKISENETLSDFYILKYTNDKGITKFVKDEASCFLISTTDLNFAKHYDKIKYPKNIMSDIIKKYEKLYPYHTFNLCTVIIKTEYRLTNCVIEN
jgi:hypothetical protein